MAADLDIFKATQTSMGGAILTNGGYIGSVLGNLMLNLRLAHQRRVTRLYELGQVGNNRRHFLVNGPTEGTMDVGHLLGPPSALTAFLDTYGDICRTDKNSIPIEAVQKVCAGAAEGSVRLTAQYCVLTQYGLQIDAQQPIPQTNAQLMFTGLDRPSAAGGR